MAFEEFKKDLEGEKVKLESELSKIARKNPKNPDDWEVKAPEMNPMTSDQSEMADVFEEMEMQTGLEHDLEERLNKVKAALERIENGTYGICGVCGKPIEIARLKANFLAKNCIQHAKK